MDNILKDIEAIINLVIKEEDKNYILSSLYNLKGDLASLNLKNKENSNNIKKSFLEENYKSDWNLFVSSSDSWVGNPATC